MTEEYNETSETSQSGVAGFEREALQALAEYRQYYRGARRRALLRLAIASAFFGPLAALSIAYGIEQLGSSNGVLVLAAVPIALLLAVGFSVSAARHWGDSIWWEKWLEMALYNYRLEIRFSSVLEIGESRVNAVGSEVVSLRNDWERLKQEAGEIQAAAIEATRSPIAGRLTIQTKRAGRRREPQLDAAYDRITSGEDRDAIFLDLVESRYYPAADKSSRDSFKKSMELRAREAAN